MRPRLLLGPTRESVNLFSFPPNLELGDLLRKRASDSRFPNNFTRINLQTYVQVHAIVETGKDLGARKKRSRPAIYTRAERKDINFWRSRRALLGAERRGGMSSRCH